MSEWRQTRSIARWEFRRFVKPKQLFVTFLLTLGAGGIGFGLARAAARAPGPEARVAVIGGEALGLAGTSPADRLTLAPFPPAAADSLRELVRTRELPGLLVVRGTDSAELHVAREPVWRRDIQTRLAVARQTLKLREAGLAPDRLASILAAVHVDVRLPTGGRGGRAERIFAIAAVSIVLYGVFTAVAYMFVSVTGEKQLRVTEQLVSAISPQAWIDGKILGIAGVAAVSTATFIVGGALFFVGRAAATGTWRLPSFAARPGVVLLVLLFAILGYALWIAFLGAVAATVDDPNTSTRGPMMLVPIFLAAPGFMIVRSPESTFAQISSLVPVTSFAAMPVRLALADVPAWEVIVSAALLAATIWFMRRAAGRIFAIGMLLFGKEPSWREVRRWSREK